MKSRTTMLVITTLLTAFAGTTLAAGVQETGGGMEMHGKSGDDSGGRMPMMDKEAMMKCKKQCMALQKTLEEVQAMVEKAEKQGEKQKLESVRSALDKLVKGMMARPETCPMMQMMQMKQKEEGKKSGMGGMHHPMGE